MPNAKPQPCLCWLDFKENSAVVWMALYGLGIWLINGATILFSLFESEGYLQGVVAISLVAIFSVLIMLLFFRMKSWEPTFIKPFLFFVITSIVSSSLAALSSSWFLQQTTTGYHDIEGPLTLSDAFNYPSAKGFEFISGVRVQIDAYVPVFTNTTADCLNQNPALRLCSLTELCAVPVLDSADPSLPGTVPAWLICENACPITLGSTSWECSVFGAPFSPDPPTSRTQPLDTAGVLSPDEFPWSVDLRNRALALRSITVPSSLLILQSTNQKQVRKDALVLSLIILFILFTMWLVAAFLAVAKYQLDIRRTHSIEAKRVELWRERRPERKLQNQGRQGGGSVSFEYSKAVQFQTAHEETLFNEDSAAQQLYDDHRELIAEAFSLVNPRARKRLPSPPPETETYDEYDSDDYDTTTSSSGDSSDETTSDSSGEESDSSSEPSTSELDSDGSLSSSLSSVYT